MSHKAAGDKVRLTFARDGKQRTVEVTLIQSLTAQRRYSVLQQELVKAATAGDHAKVAEICRQQAALAHGAIRAIQTITSLALAHLGKKDEALTALKLAVNQGADVEQIRNNDSFDSLRSDERFAKIVGNAAKPNQQGDQQAAQRVNQIHVEGAKAMQEKNYSRARELLGELFLLDKEDNSAWYDLACVESLTGHKDKALDCLKKAFDYGYANFRHLARDTDLDSIRSLPQYKDFLAHKDQIQRASAVRIEQGLRKRMGSGYQTEIDDEDRLVFVTDVAQQTLRRVQAEALRAGQGPVERPVRQPLRPVPDGDHGFGERSKPDDVFDICPRL